MVAAVHFRLCASSLDIPPSILRRTKDGLAVPAFYMMVSKSRGSIYIWGLIEATISSKAIAKVVSTMSDRCARICEARFLKPAPGIHDGTYETIRYIIVIRQVVGDTVECPYWGRTPWQGVYKVGARSNTSSEFVHHLLNEPDQTIVTSLHIITIRGVKNQRGSPAIDRL
jgi:hypothetical protein